VTRLPIHQVLPDLLAALRAGSSAVLVAPPGAGKTTAVGPALLGERWCTGEVLLLSPRRLAARAAAERMAELAGEPVGHTIGYATRLDSRRSAATRLTVLTEGIFLKRIQGDPELAGVSAVLFDEVHERSLDSDFGLALALDAQAALRPDLRIVAMSATLDGAGFSELMEGAPVIASEGRSHPVEIVHLGRAAEQRVEDGMAGAIRRAVGEAQGSLLAFLPGMAEIEWTAERLALPPDTDLFRLHGGLDPAEQRAAIGAAAAGRRKVVLATSIAETSLTPDGVRIVVDSGLARRPRYDRDAGLTRLVTERASQASVTQRAGRAGRQGPGRVYRLWEEAGTAGRPRFDPPELLEADLSPVLLDCLIWGVADPRELRWLDPPPTAAIDEAWGRLRELGAVDRDGRPTPHGRALAALPLPLRLGHMLVEAAGRGWAGIAAEVAVLLSERGLGGSEADLDLRLRRWRGERGRRAEAARRLARRWQSLLPSPLQGRGGRSGAEPGEGQLRSHDSPPPPAASQPYPSPQGEKFVVGACLALVYPDRLCRRRDAGGGEWLSVGGRGFRLDPALPLARCDWLAVAEVGGSAGGARILSAAATDMTIVERLFAHRIRSEAKVLFDPASGGVMATRGRWLGAIRLSGGQDSGVAPEAITAALIAGVRQHGLALLPWPEEAHALRQRVAFARRFDADLPDLDDSALLARLDEWLEPLLGGVRRLDGIRPGALVAALEGLLDWPHRQLLDRIAPATFATPAGSRHAIDYAADAGPTVSVRVQALFGLAEHPHVGGGAVPLILALTSPAGRPIQTTADLPGFWKGSWAAVAKEMRGRYPKHPWPADPAAADPTLRTKRTAGR